MFFWRKVPVNNANGSRYRYRFTVRIIITIITNPVLLVGQDEKIMCVLKSVIK